MKNLLRISFSIIFFTLVAHGNVVAQNKVVVIPMAGDDLKPLANIITVAKENGDFSDPIAAMNSITDASETNPYLVVIAPGDYDLGTGFIDIKSFVRLAGSGPQATILRSTRASTIGGAIQFNDNANLQDLSLIVSGTSSSSQIALGNISAGKNIISNVHVLMDNENSTERNAYFVRATDSIIRDSVFEITGGTGTAYGIRSSGAGTDLIVSDMIIALPSTSTNRDPITFSTGGTVSATCNFVISKTGTRINASSQGSILGSDCN